MKNVSPTGKVIKTVAKPVSVVPPVVNTETKTEPTTSAAIGALVAATVKAEKPETKAAPKKAEKPAAEPKVPAFVRTEQNGRKNYAPGSVGDQIWTAADALKAKMPDTAVTASLMRLALPMVNVRSISCGLTHWRKFHGVVAVKAAVVAPTV